MSMEHFEYLVHSSDVALDALALNEWGISGWELVAIIRDGDRWRYYFKRRYYVS